MIAFSADIHAGLIITGVAALGVAVVVVVDRARKRRTRRREEVLRLFDEQVRPLSESLQRIVDRAAAARALGAQSQELTPSLEAVLQQIAADGGAVDAFRRLAGEVEPELARGRRSSGTARRGTYEDELDREVARARRTGRAFSLALFDLDDPTGERLLQFAALLTRATRATDVVCRRRRNAFGILLPETTAAGARRFDDRLRAEASIAFERDCPAFATGIVEWSLGEATDSLDARARAALGSPAGEAAPKVLDSPRVS